MKPETTKRREKDALSASRRTLPSGKFLRRQQWLGELMRQGSPPLHTPEWRANSGRKDDLRELLHAEFTTTFGFAPDRYRRAEKFYRWWIQRGSSELGLVDHPSFYQYGENLILVAQPYGLRGGVASLQSWAEDCNALSWAVIPEWSYHFPGKTTMFYVEWSRWTQKQKLDWKSRRFAK
ncbi:MAG TPA: hypothetical protein VGG02_03190 [Chthoniobacterales bacterium]|jgi:hypothetical protein